jgi:hypothetical protein
MTAIRSLSFLIRGRLQPGFSTGMPHADLLGDLVHDGDWRTHDLSYRRIDRLGSAAQRAAGEPVSEELPRLHDHDDRGDGDVDDRPVVTL